MTTKREGSGLVYALVLSGRTVVAIASIAGLIFGVGMALYVIGMGGFGAQRANPWVVLGLFTPVPFFIATLLTSVRHFSKGSLIVLGVVVALSGAYIFMVILGSADALMPGLVLGAFSVLWLCVYLHRLSTASQPTTPEIHMSPVSEDKSSPVAVAPTPPMTWVWLLGLALAYVAAYQIAIQLCYSLVSQTVVSSEAKMLLSSMLRVVLASAVSAVLVCALYNFRVGKIDAPSALKIGLLSIAFILIKLIVLRGPNVFISLVSTAPGHMLISYTIIFLMFQITAALAGEWASRGKAVNQ